jgi:FG-GAP-like repeat/Secretion system C-terminal sorting domain
MFIYNPDLPAISDMDGDGDLDVAAFSLDFTFSRNIFYYKNLSVERGFGRDSLIYSAVSDCFGQFSESGANNTVILSGRTDSCGDNPWWRAPIVQGGSRHLGSSLTLQDLNGDNRPEILMGDVSVNALNAINTTRINDTLVGISQDSTFPSYNTSVSLLSFPAAYFLDVNNDGKLDMIAATNEQAYSETVTDSTSWLYLNTGSNSNIQLSLHQKDFFYNQSLDFGNEAHPAVFDYNGDGLLDILVGNNYNTSNNRSVRAGFSLLLNVGTVTQPRFRVDNSYLPSLSTITVNLNSLYPTVGDVDADGDMDLVVGTGSAGLIYFRNSGGAGQPVQWSVPVVDYLGLSQNLGSYLAPQLFDLDRDGDLDLLLGENSGNLNYIQNTGTPQNPVFANTATDNLLGDISLYVGGSRRLVPFFTREQNITQLYLGHEQGNVIQMGNIDNNLAGKFDTLTANFQNIYMGNYSALAMADLNGDTTLDMVLGNIRGGLSFFMSADTNHTVDIIDWSADLDNSILYPNPVIDRFSINFGRPSQGNVTFSFITPLGTTVFQQVRPGGRTQYNFNIESLKRGVYYLQSVRDNQQKTFMIIKR